MESSVFGWGIAAACAVVFVALGVVAFRSHVRDRGNTPMVALVRRRRELTSQLQSLAGDSAGELLRAEARRHRGSVTDIAVLERAVDRAERVSALAELASDAK